MISNVRMGLLFLRLVVFLTGVDREVDLVVFLLLAVDRVFRTQSTPFRGLSLIGNVKTPGIILNFEGCGQINEVSGWMLQPVVSQFDLSG